MGYEWKRPDGAAMERLLAQLGDSTAGVILRLAWQAGLSRGELQSLLWTQVDFPAHSLTLPRRTVPMEPSLESCLQQRYARCGGDSHHVVITERDRRPMPPESVSRLARQALDGAGLAVSLKDLRQDFQLRALETHDWTYAARVSGLSVSTLRGDFAPYLRTAPAAKTASPTEMREREYLLWRVVQQEGSSAVGLALWMAWQLKMQPGEIAVLTWQQVDFVENRILLPERAVSMGSRLRRMLQEAWQRQSPLNDRAVFIAPSTGSPMTLPRLTTLVRTALIRGGLEQVDLRTLCAWARSEEETGALMTLARERGSFTMEEAAAALGMSPAAARRRVNRLREEGQLLRQGTRYSPAESALSPAEQAETVRGWLREHGTGRRADFAEVLHLPPAQVSRLLRRMVAQGELTAQGRRYALSRRNDP